jgi:hypothetical protein
MEDSQEIQKAWLGGGAQRVGPLLPGSYDVALVRAGRAAQRQRLQVTAAPAEQPLLLRLAPTQKPQAPR